LQVQCDRHGEIALWQSGYSSQFITDYCPGLLAHSGGSRTWISSHFGNHADTHHPGGNMPTSKPKLLDAALQRLDHLSERIAKHPDPERNEYVSAELRKLREEIVQISDGGRVKNVAQTLINLAAIVRYINDHWPGT
jgi:hypothetical protein